MLLPVLLRPGCFSTKGSLLSVGSTSVAAESHLTDDRTCVLLLVAALGGNSAFELLGVLSLDLDLEASASETEGPGSSAAVTA